MSYEDLKLKNQLCHPLYSAANALIRAYTPVLKEVDLTYPQYIVMMSLWENDSVNIRTLTERTYFDSGSLTPLLKRLSDKGLVSLETMETDQRNKIVKLTKKGLRLAEKAKDIPSKMACLSGLSRDQILALKKLSEEFLKTLG